MTMDEKVQADVAQKRNASIDKLWGEYYGPDAKHSKKHSKAADQMVRMKARMAAEKEKKDTPKENKQAPVVTKKELAQPAVKTVVKTDVVCADRLGIKATIEQAKKKPQTAHELNKPAKAGSRNALMKQARAMGIKYFRVMNRDELEEVLKSGTTKERITVIAEGAKKRWQAGWKFNKKG